MFTSRGADSMGKYSGAGGGGDIDAATTSLQGKVELATQAETTGGTVDTMAVTPAGLHTGLAGLTDVTVTASDKIVHIDVSDSGKLKIDTIQGILDLVPSVSTASDSTAGIIEIATDAETLTGTATNRAVTPANLVAKINQLVVVGNAQPTLTAGQSGAVIYLDHANSGVTLPNGCAVGTHFTIINNTGSSEAIGLNTNGAILSGLPNNTINDHLSKTFICVTLSGSSSTWAVIG